MDAQYLSNLFATTYNPDPNVRKAAELEIRKIAGHEGLVAALLQIVGADGVDVATRQACSVYLKNRVQKSYIVDSARARVDHPSINTSDREALKASIIPLLVASPSKSISVQLASTLKTLISHDFPERWPNLLASIQTLVSSGNSHQVIAGCTAALEIVKVLRFRQQKPDILPDLVTQLFPQLVTVATQLMSTPPTGPSQDIPIILHLIFKAYKTSIILTLTKHQQSSESLVPWGRLLFQVVNFQPPREGVPEDDDERERCEWWKAKKWAYGILTRLFHRYGNPSQLPTPLKKDYAAFAEHFVTAFAPEIFKIYLHQVELLVSGQIWISKKCQYQIFTYFTECVKPKSTWALLKPHFESLVASFVFPQLSFNATKQLLWETDPEEYIRTSIDEYEDFAAPVSAATTFLFSLVSNRTKSTFKPILGYVNSVLESNPLPAQKFGALNMTAALGPYIMRHPEVKNNLEQFLVRHVLPEFMSSLGYMRAIACEVIGTLEKAGLTWSNPENLASASRAVASALDDPELPVQIQGALALTEMVTSHESVQAAVGAEVEKVMQCFLKLSETTELDILNGCMETMVERYHQEILPVAIQLTARLCDTYMRLLREIIAQNDMDTEAEIDNLDLASGDDDKTFAAMGVAKTISTIISSVDHAKDVLAQIEDIIIPIIKFTLDNKVLDLFDNMYDLVDSLTFNLRRISAELWPIFELTYGLFKSDAIDFLDEMLPSLDNFISFGSDVLKRQPEYKFMVLDIYTTAMNSEQLGENDRVNACKLIESFLLNLRGSVDDALPSIISTSFNHMNNAITRALQLANLEVLVNAVLYNPSVALHLMESTQPNAARVFFDKWFTTLKIDNGLPRVHDKKLSIMTLCSLLEMDPASVPTHLQDGWVGIVAAILEVFKDLPKAVEARKALEDAMAADDDDDDKLVDTDILELNEDDDADVWDEDSQYVEMLAQEGARLRAKAEKSNDDDDDTVSESTTDDDSIDEELGFISPLDTVDPYVTFKNALTVFQQNNGGGYQAATTSLNVEQQTLLMEVMAIAEKNANGSQVSVS